MLKTCLVLSCRYAFNDSISYSLKEVFNLIKVPLTTFREGTFETKKQIYNIQHQTNKKRNQILNQTIKMIKYNLIDKRDHLSLWECLSDDGEYFFECRIMIARHETMPCDLYSYSCYKSPSLNAVKTKYLRLAKLPLTTDLGI